MTVFGWSFNMKGTELLEGAGNHKRPEVKRHRGRVRVNKKFFNRLVPRTTTVTMRTFSISSTIKTQRMSRLGSAGLTLNHFNPLMNTSTPLNGPRRLTQLGITGMNNPGSIRNTTLKNRRVKNETALNEGLSPRCPRRRETGTLIITNSSSTIKNTGRRTGNSLTTIGNFFNYTRPIRPIISNLY